MIKGKGDLSSMLCAIYALLVIKKGMYTVQCTP